VLYLTMKKCQLCSKRHKHNTCVRAACCGSTLTLCSECRLKRTHGCHLCSIYCSACDRCYCTIETWTEAYTRRIKEEWAVGRELARYMRMDQLYRRCDTCVNCIDKIVEALDNHLLNDMSKIAIQYIER
jgi:hypothetical protein